MREWVNGYPEIGSGARLLGVRPGIDVPALLPADVVFPGQGGVSVGPSDPMNLPYFRRPPELGGTGRDPVWSIDESVLGSEITYRTDPSNAQHGFLEPARPMTLLEFQSALARTQLRWYKESP